MAEQSNNGTSPPTLAEALHGYSVHVDTWSVNDGETWAMLYCRELLHDNLASLTDAERQQLVRCDYKARKLLAAHRHVPDPYMDVRILGEVVMLIESE